MVFPLLLDKRGAGIDDGEGGGVAAGPVTLTLNPVADSQVLSNTATTNYGTNQYINFGDLNPAGGVGIMRTFIKFDLSSIPAGSTITSAKLSLYALADFADNARTASVYRLKRAWVESQVTWSVYSTGNNWATAGGFGAADCEQTDIGSRAYTASETLNEYKEFTLDASAIQEMITGGSFVNNGFLIKMATELDDDYRHASHDHATPSIWPELEIVYTNP